MAANSCDTPGCTLGRIVCAETESVTFRIGERSYTINSIENPDGSRICTNCHHNQQEAE